MARNTNNLDKAMAGLLGGLVGAVGGVLARAVAPATSRISDPLTDEIRGCHSPRIVGYFLDSDNDEYIDYGRREAALEAAVRLVNDPSVDGGGKSHLQTLIECIAENKDDDLYEEAKEQLMSYADDSELSGIALDEDEDTDVCISAIEKMTDTDLLLDIAAGAEDNDVRQAAKTRMMELR